jgi:gluconolactonase
MSALRRVTAYPIEPMTNARISLVATGLLASVGLANCSPATGSDGGKGGNLATGGATLGGAPSGGSNAQGGNASGGASNPGSGGSSQGGAMQGGATNGGAANGGASTSNGGAASGGTSNSSGGTSSGGAGGATAGNGSGKGGSAGAAGATNGSGGNSGNRYVCPSVAAGTNPLPSNTTPTVVTGAPPADSFNGNNNDFKILEGPVWYQDSLYFSEIKNGTAPPPARVLKVSGAGTVSVAIPQANAGCNGLALDQNGKLVGANHTLGAIVRLDPTGAAAPEVIVGTYMSSRFNSPNDLTVRSDGNIYFTDPQHQAGSTKITQRVYRIAPGATTATIIQDNSNGPNGITLSIDENTLFISHGPDSGGIDKYPLNADGSVGMVSVLTTSFNSDGMAIDCAGNLYLSQSSKIVVISSTTGMKVGEIAVSGVQASTNVAFGGPEHKTLYITSLGNNAKLLKLDLNVPGMPY